MHKAELLVEFLRQELKLAHDLDEPLVQIPVRVLDAMLKLYDGA